MRRQAALGTRGEEDGASARSAPAAVDVGGKQEENGGEESARDQEASPTAGGSEASIPPVIFRFLCRFLFRSLRSSWHGM